MMFIKKYHTFFFLILLLSQHHLSFQQETSNQNTDTSAQEDKKRQIPVNEILQIDYSLINSIVPHFDFSLIFYYDSELDQDVFKTLKEIQAVINQETADNNRQAVLFGTVNIEGKWDRVRECIQQQNEQKAGESDRKKSGCLFLNTKFQKQKYNNDRLDKENLINWLLNNLRTQINVIRSQEDWQNFNNIKNEHKILLGYNKRLEKSGEVQQIIENMIQGEQFLTHDIQDVYVIQDRDTFENVFHGGERVGFDRGRVNFPFMMMLKNTQFNQPKVVLYEGYLNNTDLVNEFLYIQSLPLVTRLSQNTFVKVFGGTLKTAVHLILDPNINNDNLIQQYEKAALVNQYQGLQYERAAFTYSYIGDELEDLPKQFQVKDPQQTPFLGITQIDHSDFTVLKFKYQNAEGNGIGTERSEDQRQKILEFLEDYRMKKLPIFYRSEDIPANSQWNEDNIYKFRKIVGSNFQDVVLKEQQNFIVLFYDSRSPSASAKMRQNILQIIEQTDKDMLKRQLRFCQFDLYLNENQRVQFDQAPVLALYHLGHQHQPILFDGQPTVDNIRGFLNYYVTDFQAEDPSQPVLSLGGGSGSTQKKDQTNKYVDRTDL